MMIFWTFSLRKKLYAGVGKARAEMDTAIDASGRMVSPKEQWIPAPGQEKPAEQTARQLGGPGLITGKAGKYNIKASGRFEDIANLTAVEAEKQAAEMTADEKNIVALGILKGGARLAKRISKLRAGAPAAEKRGRGADPEDLDYAGLGLRLQGISQDQALQQAMAMAQKAGGTWTGMKAANMLAPAFAAQTVGGIGMDVSGAFLGGGRGGGLVGGMRRGKEGIESLSAEQFTKAMADGWKMGALGSGIQDYMQIIAEGITSFDTTGIPISKDSFASMGMTFSQAGMGATRAMNVAAGVRQYTAGVSQRGPQGGMDLLAMQMLGGYTGGGSEDYEKAMIQLESMKSGEKDIGGPETQKMFQHIMKIGGGGARGRNLLRGLLQESGIQIGAKEMSILGKQMAGESLTDAEQIYLDQSAEMRKIGAAKAARPLEEQAEKIVTKRGGLVQARASITNKQIAVGGQVAGSVNKLEVSALNMNQAFLNLANNGIQTTADKLLKLSEGIEKFTAGIEKAGGVWEVLFGGQGKGAGGAKGPKTHTKASPTLVPDIGKALVGAGM